MNIFHNIKNKYITNLCLVLVLAVLLVGVVFIEHDKTNFILSLNNNFFAESVRRVRVISKEFNPVEKIAQLKNEAMISRWNTVFVRLNKEAEVNPDSYNKITLIFDRGEGQYDDFFINIPKNIDSGNRQIVVKYLAAAINNRIVTRATRAVAIRTGVEGLANKLITYFNTHYNSPEATTKIKELVGTYAGVDEFKIVPYTPSFGEGKSSIGKNPSTDTEILFPATLVTVNIGKTKIKSGLVRINERGDYEFVGELKDVNAWEQGEDRTKVSRIIEQVKDSIKSTLASSNLTNADIDGIAMSAAVVIKNNRPLVKVGFAKHLDDENWLRLAGITDEISREFSNLPVTLANDGDVEAIALAETGGYSNTLVMKLGTTLAVGYIGVDGRVIEDLNEFGRVVIDLSANAHLHKSTMVKGDVGRYISWQGIENTAQLLGLYDKYSFDSDVKVPLLLKKWLAEGTIEQRDDAVRVFSKLGEYTAVIASELSSYYTIENVVLSGGLVSGKAGEILIQSAKKTAKEINPASKIKFIIDISNKEILRYGALIGASYLALNKKIGSCCLISMPILLISKIHKW